MSPIELPEDNRRGANVISVCSNDAAPAAACVDDCRNDSSCCPLEEQ